jgi:phosphatidylinositol glycan class C protein
MSPKKPWKKNLYENQEYEDNYTDPSFLKDLQKNLNVKTYSFLECFFGVTILSQNISCVTLFLIVFYYLYMGEIAPQKVLFFNCFLTSLGYLMYVGSSEINLPRIVEDSKTVLVVLLFGFIFSPLLHTLTDSISTDTIFFSTSFVLFMHLLLHDYEIDGFLVSKAISLNAGIFASICLASRLSSSFHAFTLLVIAAEVFALKPLLFQKVWKPYFVIPIILASCYYLFSISKVLLVIYLIVLTFVNLFCPFIFCKLNNHVHKNQVKGSWDEAIPILQDSREF